MKPTKAKRTRRWVLGLAILILLLVGGLFAGTAVLKSLYPVPYEDVVEIYADDYELEKSFVYAVVKCESGFDARAVSSVGARGLMQMLPATFEDLQGRLGETLPPDALFDPETAIRYGCYYYHYLMGQFGGDEALAVCAYHAGIGNVKKWLADPRYSKDGKTLDEIPFQQTKNYLKRVQRTQKIYQLLYYF